MVNITQPEREREVERAQTPFWQSYSQMALSAITGINDHVIILPDYPPHLRPCANICQLNKRLSLG